MHYIMGYNISGLFCIVILLLDYILLLEDSLLSHDTNFQSYTGLYVSFPLRQTFKAMHVHMPPFP